MATPTFDMCCQLALNQYGVSFDLKAEQKCVLEHIFSGQDTLAILPTGYGKSLIFQLIPYMMSFKLQSQCPLITLVVTPISAIMEDQLRSLASKNIKAGHLLIDGTKFKTFEVGSDGEISEHLHNVTNLAEAGHSHPESLVCNNKVRKLLASKPLCDRICCIAVDEVHMISEW
ncbi:probable ATP-dependent DNA helicase RecS [Argopecten irradians]|uniref:probable ATP-dependent DNA helicase RecS n=1 Tax=Argopecten irradians TaxID=31199 RepID=UPI00371500A2